MYNCQVGLVKIHTHKFMASRCIGLCKRVHIKVICTNLRSKILSQNACIEDRMKHKSLQLSGTFTYEYIYIQYTSVKYLEIYRVLITFFCVFSFSSLVFIPFKHLSTYHLTQLTSSICDLVSSQSLSSCAAAALCSTPVAFLKKQIHMHTYYLRVACPNHKFAYFTS